LKDCVVVGGIGMVDQGSELKRNPHIVIATPGRLADHLQSCKTFSLKRIKFLVLDEADRLLEGNFDEQMEVIFSALPAKRQTLLFSATINNTLTQLQDISQNKPFFFDYQSSIATRDELTQKYLLCPADFKDGYLIHLLEKILKDKQGLILVFVNTCRECQLMSLMLKKLGFENVALHSRISQKLRLAALSNFKSHTARILIATNVASRGLDIPLVQYVINYDVPLVAKDYIHRVGRTARAGRPGTAITFVSQNDVNLLHAIEDHIGTKLTSQKVDDKEVSTILTQTLVTKKEMELMLESERFDEKQEIYRRKNLIRALQGGEQVQRKKRARDK